MDTRTMENLLRQAGRSHHQAYITSDGVDPEWALWYSGYLQTHIWDAFGEVPARSDLVYLLIECDRAYRAAHDPGEWPAFYSERFVEYLGG